MCFVSFFIAFLRAFVAFYERNAIQEVSNKILSPSNGRLTACFLVNNRLGPGYFLDLKNEVENLCISYEIHF